MKRAQISAAVALLALVLLAGSVTVQSAQDTPPALTDPEMEQFLLTAKVIKTKSVSTGITGTQRATLSDGRLTHDASVQTIDISKPTMDTGKGIEINFRDSYRYNIAAYRLDRLLNLNMIPVSVSRKVAGKTGAVTWWVDNVQMMEKDRYLKKIDPPDQSAWNDQMYQARVFNELVYNTDANLGNLLITNDWQLKLVDFSRGFRMKHELRSPENLTNCHLDHRVYSGLRGLNEQALQQKMGDVLSNQEIQGLLARRDKIVTYFEQQIAQKGEGNVICNQPGH